MVISLITASHAESFKEARVIYHNSNESIQRASSSDTTASTPTAAELIKKKRHTKTQQIGGSILIPK